MSFIDKYSNAFRYILPNPLTIALLLTIFTLSLALLWPTKNHNLKVNLTNENDVYTAVSNQKILWNNSVENNTFVFNKSAFSAVKGAFSSKENGYETTIDFQLEKNNKIVPLILSKPKFLQLISFWYDGLWGKGGLTFAFQMMLMLVLGHIIALSNSVEKLIKRITPFCNTSSKAALLVTLLTLITSWFNWGLGLIFGAIFARKVGEYAHKKNIAINYALVGAAGYSGLMIWHGGISGSSLIKVAENGHFKELITNENLLAQLPSTIGFNDTVFSSMNLTVTLVLFLILPCLMYFLGKKKNASAVPATFSEEKTTKSLNARGAEKIDYSSIFTTLIGVSMLAFSIYLAISNPRFSELKFIDPNYLNFLLLGLAILLSGNITNFLHSLDKAIKGVGGILIQFPLYFGIMGVMSNSGMINDIAQFFISISNAVTYPLFTLISAGLVNLFVPSGGGQWYVQGPIVIQTAIEMKISLSKSIMALAYGDQLTNMLQPFWALPLLGITGLKARDILPYTLILMLVGFLVFSFALILF